jgi:hypothetical protein
MKEARLVVDLNGLMIEMRVTQREGVEIQAAV